MAALVRQLFATRAPASPLVLSAFTRSKKPFGRSRAYETIELFLFELPVAHIHVATPSPTRVLL